MLAFKSLQTQWMVTVAGEQVVYTGLNYGSIPVALSMVGAKRREAQEITLGLQLMESAALEVLNAKDAE